MARIVPHQHLMDRSKTFERVSGIFIIVSSVLSIILVAMSSDWSQDDYIIKALNAINCAAIFLVFLFETLFNYFFYIAGTAKRLDFIDNSLGTDFTDSKSQEYFSNDKLPKGIFKMAVNCFENSFFTSQVSSKMLVTSWIKVIAVVLIFVFSAAWGERQIVLTLFQLSLPIMMAQNVVRLTQFSTRISGIYQSFLVLFNDIKQSKSHNTKEPEMLKLIMDYQTTLSWGGILLDSKIFNSINPKLSKDWEEIKKKYEII
jgi:hypothetical protein